MRVLVLGGTRFLGRSFVEAALDRGHAVTLFHRGKSGADLFAGVERILGDRDGGLEPLRGRTWDAVLDTCGFVPRIVRASARLLAPSIGRYVFVSSVSVYRDAPGPVDETSPLEELKDPTVEKVDGDTYGGLKVLCEREVEAALEGRALVVRPGLIVGPHDPSDRFTYWVRRVANGGIVAAPGRRERKVQVVDARDLAGWLLSRIEGGGTGTFNAAGTPVTMERVLLECVDRAAVALRWLDEPFLEAQKVVPYVEMPLWIPGRDDAIDTTRAAAAGMTCRALRETIADTRAWDRTRDPAVALKAGVTPARERDLLEAWDRLAGN